MGTKGDGWTTRGVPRLKRLGWGGWVVERNVVVRAKFLAIRRGTERFYPVSPPPLSDQECLSRLEWFIPSISGDYFIYRSGEGGTLLPLDAAAPRCVASRRISITSFSFPSSFAKLRSKRLARIIHHPVDVSVSGAFSKNYQISYPLEFLTRQLPLRGHKGSYFLNSSATRIPSGVWGVVSYTGCVCVYICRLIPPDRGPNIFVGEERRRFDPLRFRSIFNATVDGESVFFFIYRGIEEGRIGESGSVSLFFLEDESARWKSIGNRTDLLASSEHIIGQQRLSFAFINVIGTRFRTLPFFLPNDLAQQISNFPLNFFLRFFDRRIFAAIFINLLSLPL